MYTVQDVIARLELTGARMNKRVLKTMIQQLNKQNIDDTDEYGDTLLCIAVKKQFYKVVKLILQKGANPNMPCNNVSPLYIACHKNNLDIIKLLVKYGADVRNTDPLFDLIISCSKNKNIAASMDYLINNGARIDVTDTKNLTYAILGFNTDAVEVLLAHGANIQLLSRNWQDPLGFAVCNNLLDMVKLLLKYNFIITEDNINNYKNPINKEIEKLLKINLNGQNIKFAGSRKI